MLNNTLIKASLLSLSLGIFAEKIKFEVPVATKKEKLNSNISQANTSFQLAEQLSKKIKKSPKKIKPCKLKKWGQLVVDDEAMFNNHIAKGIYNTVQALNNGAKIVSTEPLRNVQKLIASNPNGIQKSLEKITKNTVSKKDCSDFFKIVLLQNSVDTAIKQIKSDDPHMQKAGRENYFDAFKQLKNIQTSKNLRKYKALAGNETYLNYLAEVYAQQIPEPEYFTESVSKFAKVFSDSCK